MKRFPHRAIATTATFDGKLYIAYRANKRHHLIPPHRGISARYPVQPFSCDCMQNHPLGFANACEHNQPALCTSSLARTSVPYSCRNHFSATAPAATRPAPAHSRTSTTCAQDDTAANFADIYLQRGMTEKTGLAVNPPLPLPRARRRLAPATRTDCLACRGAASAAGCAHPVLDLVGVVGVAGARHPRHLRVVLWPHVPVLDKQRDLPQTHSGWASGWASCW
jgi:hypothetical protein